MLGVAGPVSASSPTVLTGSGWHGDGAPGRAQLGGSGGWSEHGRGDRRDRTRCPFRAAGRPGRRATRSVPHFSG